MSHTVVALLINYRDAKRTADCVRTLLDSSIVRVVVWDNSEDDGLSSAELTRLFHDDGRVDVETSSRNLGFAAGVNRGIEACRRLVPQAWILLINNDTIAPPRLAEALSIGLERNLGSMLAFPALLHAGKRIDEVYYHRWLGLLSHRPHPGGFRLPRGCCVMLAADRWAGQLFDEDFFMYGEEVELGWRLRHQTGAMVHVPEMVVVHEGARSSGVNSLFYEARMVAAHLILVRKLGTGRIEKSLLYLLRLPGLLARAVLRSIRYRSSTPWKGLWHGARLAADPSRHIEPSLSGNANR